MGGDDAGSAYLIFLYVNVAVLEDGSAIAKDEVHGAGDLAFSVELPAGLHKQCVLISSYLAPVKGGAIAAGYKCHRLHVCLTRGVLEPYVNCNESLGPNSYWRRQIKSITNIMS